MAEPHRVLISFDYLAGGIWWVSPKEEQEAASYEEWRRACIALYGPSGQPPSLRDLLSDQLLGDLKHGTTRVTAGSRRRCSPSGSRRSAAGSLQSGAERAGDRWLGRALLPGRLGAPRASGRQLACGSLGAGLARLRAARPQEAAEEGAQILARICERPAAKRGRRIFPSGVPAWPGRLTSGKAAEQGGR